MWLSFLISKSIGDYASKTKLTCPSIVLTLIYTHSRANHKDGMVKPAKETVIIQEYFRVSAYNSQVFRKDYMHVEAMSQRYVN